MDAPQGASSAVRSAPHHVGAEFSASLPAVAGGISSFNTNFSNIPAPISICAEGAASRVGFYGAAPADASHGASLAARAAPPHSGAGALPQLAAMADEGFGYQPYATNTPLSEVAGRPAREPHGMDLPNAFTRHPAGWVPRLTHSLPPFRPPEPRT